MSNILDALRKAQDEKTKPQHNTVEGGDNLIARRGNRADDAGKRLKIIIAGGATLLAVVAWFLYGPATSSNKTEKKLPVAETKVTTPETVAQTEEAPTESISEPLQAGEITVPENEDRQVAPKARKALPLEAEAESRPPVTSATTKTVATTQTDQKPAGKPVRPATSPAITEESITPPLPPPPPPATILNDVAGTPDGITISGIAWQANSRLRRAVINDLLVGEGALVAGVKVVEIKPTVVRLEKNGTIYAAPLPR